MIISLLPLLKYFDALAQTGSFTKAAEQLHISQSTVSIQIKKLEQALGVNLLDRKSKQQFTLTVEGEALAQETAYCFTRLTAQLDQIHHGAFNRGEVTVASSSAFGTQQLLPAIAKIKRANPLLTIHLQENSSEKLFYENKIDIATHYGPPPAGYHGVYIGKISKCLVTSTSYIAAHSLSHDLPLSLEKSLEKNLAQHQLIEQAGGKREWSSLLAKSGLDLSELNIQRVSSNLAKLRAIKQGLGIGILPDYLFDSADPDLVHLNQADMSSLAEDLYFICQKRRQHEGRIKWLMAELAGLLKTEDPSLVPIEMSTT
jgi:DNA-binding transcriptional LysR family regulator